MHDFRTLFQTATGHAPHGYQARIARDGLPDLVAAPTGTGKTGVILAWLWRRLYGPDPAGTPRRLVYALPQPSLLEQVSGQARGWLANLGLTDEVALQVVMGARWETKGEWRDEMHKPAIVVGAVDSLVSKALNRAWGMGRASFPIDFGLVTNGAHWVIDEIQLCPGSTTTLRQLAGIAAQLGTAEPFGLTCMSATAADGLLETPANPAVGETTGLRPEERAGELASRLAAARTVRRLRADPGDQQALAAAVRALHRPGTLTLVVLNTVPAARAVYRRLCGGPAEVTLLHSRFRGIERAGRMADALADVLPDAAAAPAGRIIVSTQAAEAGLDLSAAVLVTEAAPWPALVLRAGHCNRTGTVPDAEVWWLPPASPLPYRQQHVDAASAELDRLEGAAVTSEDLLALAVPGTVAGTGDQIRVLRRRDLAGLFDTSPGPSGEDVDIAPYLRDAGDLDAEVAWAVWTPGENGAPDPEIRYPAAEYRCRVAIGDVATLAKDRPVWRFDQASGSWLAVTKQPRSRPRPGELLLVSAADGGYDAETGFDPSARGPVPESPELLTPAEATERLAAQAAVHPELAEAELAEVVAGAGDAGPRRWQSLDEHSGQVRDQATALLAVMAPRGIPPAAARSAIIAAYLHDAGKAHEIWQDAICALAGDEEQAEIAAGRPWAKSGGKGGALLFAGGVAFRHELASLLLIDGPLSALVARSPDPDLTRYLVLAHHGKLRVQVREHHAVPPAGQTAENGIRGLRPGATTAVPAMLGQPASTLTVDLGQFGPGGGQPSNAWTRTVLGLRDRYGPFVLAYLETLVRVADWRASGGRELPGA
ncbi:MAG: DEAD/DEAH box helicase [Trebonia sp.]|jgi:CRISPR-associated endonuclease/helicase Cas3